MNITKTEQEPAALKTVIATGILENLSQKAIERLVEYEANIDTADGSQLRAGISTAYDKVHLPLVALRVYRAAFWRYWNSLYFDPKFPTFHGARLKDMISLTHPTGRPAEAVLSVLDRFAPDGYHLEWVAEQLADSVRQDWRARVAKTA